MGLFFNQEITGNQTILKADTGKTFFVSSENQATNLLTLTASNAGNNETVVIGGKTYTFQTTLTNVDGNVKIGASNTLSLANLIDAINLGAGAGTDYATLTTLHPSVSALANSTDKMAITAKRAGLAGNSILVSETLANGSWADTSNLAGGQATPNGANRDLIITLPQDADDGDDFNFIFTDDGESRNDSERVFTSWTLSSGLTKPFLVAMNDPERGPYNFRRVMNTLGALQQVKLGGIRKGNRIRYIAGEQISFISWGGVWYSTPPFGSGFYGVGEV